MCLQYKLLANFTKYLKKKKKKIFNNKIKILIKL